MDPVQIIVAVALVGLGIFGVMRAMNVNNESLANQGTPPAPKPEPDVKPVDPKPENKPAPPTPPTAPTVVVQNDLPPPPAAGAIVGKAQVRRVTEDPEPAVKEEKVETVLTNKVETKEPAPAAPQTSGPDTSDKTSDKRPAPRREPKNKA